MNAEKILPDPNDCFTVRTWEHQLVEAEVTRGSDRVPLYLRVKLNLVTLVRRSGVRLPQLLDDAREHGLGPRRTWPEAELNDGLDDRRLVVSARNHGRGVQRTL